MILKIKDLGFLLFCFLVFGLTGCGVFKEEDTSGDPKFNLQTVNIILDTDANNYSATEVDLVIAYKMDLFKSLMKMKAADYFAIAEQIRRDYPEMLKVWHWELTPGQTINEYQLSSCFMCPEAFGAVIFARYLTPGSHRVRVGSSDTIHVLLKKEDLCIVEQGCTNHSLLLPTASDNDAKKGKSFKPSQSSELEGEMKKITAVADKIKGVLK